ncbi:MAG TPA: hypothetical protein VIM62_00365 [Acidobacteriaceae bacterium]
MISSGIATRYASPGRKKVQPTDGWLCPKAAVTSAKDLFGNVTPPPNPPTGQERNGFLALAVYDANHDGVIDKKDAVWTRLRVWIDANHDAISQATELHALDEFGIRSIDLKHHESRYEDEYGNQFRYKGHLGRDLNDKVDRIIYDVFLQAGQN